MEPMKARVCANCSFLLLAHTLIELRNLEVKGSRGKRSILKLVIKASKISNAKKYEGRGDGIQKKCCNKVRSKLKHCKKGRRGEVGLKSEAKNICLYKRLESPNRTTLPLSKVSECHQNSRDFH